MELKAVYLVLIALVEIPDNECSNAAKALSHKIDKSLSKLFLEKHNSFYAAPEAKTEFPV